MSKIQIINSKNHWAAGWFGKPERIQCVIDTVLNKAKFEIEIDEVSSISELETLLDKLSPDTLIWTNAYYVNAENGENTWLNALVEKRNLPLLGSSAAVLENLLKKDNCQTILGTNGIPIPNNSILSFDNIDEIKRFFHECDIDFPMVLKPTATCLSQGVCLVNTYSEAIEKGREILINYPDSNLIIEEFLPNDDITCGYVELGENVLLMPIHYSYDNKPGKKHIYNFEDRFVIENNNRQRKVVTEKRILEQLEIMIPRIAETLNIRDITRIDGRMDKDGTLRYFDINGFPGLSFKGVISDMVAVSFLFFPNYPETVVYQALINTILANSLMRNNLPVPNIVKEHNLFTLESDLVLKVKKEAMAAFV